MEKRFQVFVSSTFKDLEIERQEVMHALLELDCIPSGMELFPAANETQWDLIKKVIDDCDYYVLILAGRYGSIGSEGLSYTEMEYRYAASKEKPIIAFIHRAPGKIIADNTETTEEGKAKLLGFRKLVETKLCKHWETPDELGSVVSRSLVQLIKSNPAVGWVRANELADRDATLELLQLRRRVDELLSEVSRLRTSAPKEAEGLAQGTEIYELQYTFKAQEPGYSGSPVTYNSKFIASWDAIFSRVGPLMINEASEGSFKSGLDSLAEHFNRSVLQVHDKIKGSRIHSFSVNSEDFQTVKIQLRALGLIKKSEKSRSVKDYGTYWTLTPFGDETLMRLRAVRKGETALSKDSTDETSGGQS